MSRSLELPPAGFEALSIEEQIACVQSLWDHIAAHAVRLPVPDWHRQILAQRLAQHRDNPADGKTWSEVEVEIIETLKRPSD